MIAGTQNSQKIIPANSMQIRNLKTIRTITTKTIGIAVITNIRINTKLREVVFYQVVFTFIVEDYIVHAIVPTLMKKILFQMQ